MSRQSKSSKPAHDVIADRDVVMGDQINITYALKMEGFQPPPDLVQLRADYLDHLKRSYRALDFKGIPQLDALSRDLMLEEVYVPLVARPELPGGETWERRLAGRALDLAAVPEEALAAMGKAEAVTPVHVEEAMAKQKRVVVLGDPGSGKSTLLKHLARRLAGEDAAPLPILVPLNAYADALSRADRNVQHYLAEHFAGQAQGIAGLAPLFESAIAQGRAVILLDGLDEVQRDRAHLVNKVEAFAREAVKRGTLYLHADWHASHYLRLLLDELFGSERLLNEIAWVYHGPSPVRRAFNRKHDTILVYAKSAEYAFNADAVRVPYDASTVQTFASSRKAGFGKAPDLARGQVPEDWYFPVVARLHGERTGYPTQKPEALVERVVKASSNEGDVVADFFCGSGTLPVVAERLRRRWLACDASSRAIHTTTKRLLDTPGCAPFEVWSAAAHQQHDAQAEIDFQLQERTLQVELCDYQADVPDDLRPRVHSFADLWTIGRLAWAIAAARFAAGGNHSAAKRASSSRAPRFRWMAIGQRGLPFGSWMCWGM